MATLNSERVPRTPVTTGLAIILTFRVLKNLVSEEVMWNHPKKAGFVEQSVKRRDKAALISYITKLEFEVYDYQNNIGILFMEKNELFSKYEEVISVNKSDLFTYERFICICFCPI